MRWWGGGQCVRLMALGNEISLLNMRQCDCERNVSIGLVCAICGPGKYCIENVFLAF